MRQIERISAHVNFRSDAREFFNTLAFRPIGLSDDSSIL